MTDVVNPKSASPDQLLPYHKKISAEGKALMICFISYTYMVLKSGRSTSVLAAFSVRFRNMEKCIDFLTTLFEGPVIRNLLWENGNRG